MINESGDTTLLRAIDDNVFLLFGYKWLRASVCVCNGFSRSPCCQSSKLSIIAHTHTHTHATRIRYFPLSSSLRFVGPTQRFDVGLTKCSYGLGRTASPIVVVTVLTKLSDF